MIVVTETAVVLMGKEGMLFYQVLITGNLRLCRMQTELKESNTKQAQEWREAKIPDSRSMAKLCY